MCTKMPVKQCVFQLNALLNGSNSRNYADLNANVFAFKSNPYFSAFDIVAFRYHLHVNKCFAALSVLSTNHFFSHRQSN